MDKIEFFQDLEEIVVDTLFIGDSEEDIDQEIATTLGQFLLIDWACFFMYGLIGKLHN